MNFEMKVAFEIPIFHPSPKKSQPEHNQCSHSHLGASLLADKGENIYILLIFPVGFLLELPNGTVVPAVLLVLTTYLESRRCFAACCKGGSAGGAACGHGYSLRKAVTNTVHAKLQQSTLTSTTTSLSVQQSKKMNELKALH